MSVTARMQERFWSRVTKTESCWIWQGPPGNNGYGQMSTQRRQHPITVHVLSYILHNGEQPEVVRHTCDNKLCVNPEHLINGTHNDNVQDKHSKKRDYREDGTYCNSRLKREDISEIIKLHQRGYPYAMIGEIFGASQETIRKIVKGKTPSYSLT